MDIEKLITDEIVNCIDFLLKFLGMYLLFGFGKSISKSNSTKFVQRSEIIGLSLFLGLATQIRGLFLFSFIIMSIGYSSQLKPKKETDRFNPFN